MGVAVALVAKAGACPKAAFDMAASKIAELGPPRQRSIVKA
ncbi:hypothetical protein K239x_33090 [Planctomycetes bacterium K23_9]|uniref:Uncharacterized protein n=1 Tax=Stieleria marina TaxID=1930275 RepID=A0A517NW15_9BACT|nr:hypothetical protein K239x_33090 [Planctomycetes bacterium K23_9]